MTFWGGLGVLLKVVPIKLDKNPAVIELPVWQLVLKSLG